MPDSGEYTWNVDGTDDGHGESYTVGDTERTCTPPLTTRRCDGPVPAAARSSRGAGQACSDGECATACTLEGIASGRKSGDGKALIGLTGGKWPGRVIALSAGVAPGALRARGV